MSTSSSQTIGYKYFLGMHTDLWHGPIDRITRIRFDERTAWCGNNFGGRLTIDAEDLFGGEKREGGVSGEVDFLPGEPTQTVNDYLKSVLSEDPIPAFRGVAALVFRQAYLGMSPYIKQLDVRGTRIYSQTDGEEQWYPEKAAIGPCGVMYQWQAGLDYTKVFGTRLEHAAGNDSGVWLGTQLTTGNQEYVSLDDGATWQATGFSFTSPLGKRCAVDRVTGEVFSYSHNVLRRTINGVDFTSEARPSTLMHVFGARNAVWVAGARLSDVNRIFYSLDLGETWTSAQNLSGIASAVVFLGGSVFVQESGSGGQGIWRASASDPSAWISVMPAGHESDPLTQIWGIGGRLFARFNSPGPALMYSDDEGDSWQEFNISAALGTSNIGNLIGSDEFTILPYTITTPTTQNRVAVTIDGQEFVDAGLMLAFAGSGVSNNRNLILFANSGGSSAEGVWRTTFAVDDECHLQPCDMNPVHAIRECITDPAWAMGWPAARIDEASFAAAADQCHAEGMGFSYEWQQQSPVGDLVDMICRQIDAELYIDRRTGKYTLYLIRADYDEGGLLTLGESEILHVEDFGAPTLGEMRNSVTVNFWEAESSSAASVTVHDQALAIMQGGTIGESIDHPGVSNRELATRIALRELRALASRRRTAVIYANRAARDLHPGAPFKLDYPDWTDDKPAIMRVARIAFGNGRTKVIRIECVEDVFSLGPLPIVGSMPSRWADPATRPLPAGERVVFEAPYWEIVRQVGQPQADLTLEYHEQAGFVMGTARRPGIAVNAEMHVDAGAGYALGATVDFSPWGILAEAVAPLDTVLPLSDDEDLDEGVIGQLALLGDELVRIDAIDIESSEHTVTVGRGCLDTVPAAHDAGTALVLWQDYAAHSTTEYASGETIDVKLLPSSPSGVVSLDVATADQLTFAQRAFRPYPPGSFEINGEAYPESLEIADYDDSAAISVSWTHRDRTLQTGAAVADTTEADIGPEAGTTYTVELRDASDDSLFDSATGLAASPADFALTGFTGTDLRVLLWAVRDAVASWQVHDWTVQVVPAAWTPDLLADSAKIWLDETTAVVEGGAGYAFSWANRGSLSATIEVFVRGTSGQQPAITESALVPRRTLTFDGVNDSMSAGVTDALDMFRNVGSGWVFAVYRKTGDDGAGQLRNIFTVSAGNTAGSTRLHAFIGGSSSQTPNSPLLAARRLDDDGTSVLDPSEPMVNEWAAVLYVVDWASGDGFVWIDGEIAAQNLSFTSSGNTSDTRSQAAIVLGANSSLGNAADMEVGEVLSSSGAIPSSSEIDKLFGYAAHKWGLQSKLPSDHPYKDDPPTA